MFRHFVDECRVVYEDTSYVEIFNYTVGSHMRSHFSQHPILFSIKGLSLTVYFERIHFITQLRSIC